MRSCGEELRQPSVPTTIAVPEPVDIGILMGMEEGFHPVDLSDEIGE